MAFMFGGNIGGVGPTSVEEQAQKTKKGLFSSIFGDKASSKASPKPYNLKRAQSKQEFLRQMQARAIQKGGIQGGLSAIGAALAQRLNEGKIDEAQEAQQGKLSALFGNLVKDPEIASALSGMSPQQQESVLGQLISGKIGRGAGLEDYEARKKIDQQYAAPPAPPKPTDDAANFQFLQQLRERGATEEDIQAFQQSAGMVGNPSDQDQYVGGDAEQRAAIEQYRASGRGPGTTVNVGDGPNLPKPPSGFSYTYKPDGTPIMDERGVPSLAPIKGGPEDPEVKAQADEKFRRVKEENARNTRQTVNYQLDVIDELLEGEEKGLAISPTSSVSGVTGLTYSKIPGTPAHDFASSLDTVKANIGFDRLQRMREASKTGAAVGQLSNRELGLLTETLAPTRQGMSPARLRDAIKVIRKMYNNPGAYEEIIGDGDFVAPKQQPGNAQFDADLDALMGLGG